MYKAVISPRSALLPAGTDRTQVGGKLVNSVRSMGVFLVARARVVVSVAGATALRNRGSVWALFDEIVLDEGGTDKMILRGNVLRYFSEGIAPSALSAVRAAVGVGTYLLEESAYIPFADPLSLDPTETAYRELKSDTDLSVRAKLFATLSARLFTIGGATVVVDQISIDVEQDYDPASMTGGVLQAPLFVPRIRQQVETITGDVTQQVATIKSSNLIRKICLSAEAPTLGEVGDVLRGFTLRGDQRYIIGPSMMTMNDFLLRGEYTAGGAVVSSNRAHTAINFQRYGKLSECLNPYQDANLRFELSALPSASDGGATASIRITFVELERDLAIVSPTVPFNY